MARSKTDLEIVKEMKAGRFDGFEELLSRYSAKAFSLARRLTRNEQDAEEVLQDVFVTVFRKIKNFEGKSSFSSWLYRVTVNSALMKLRKRRQDRSVSIEEGLGEVVQHITRRSIEQGTLESINARQELAQLLEAAIQKLPDEYRPVFIMRDVDGLSSREVGKILDITIPAVKSRLHRSRLMLRRRLAGFFREFTADERGKCAGNE